MDRRTWQVTIHRITKSHRELSNSHTQTHTHIFLSEQRKEIQGNNRMGKTRDLFKKIRATKETFHAKMGLIKDRKGRDLIEAEDIKKRWQEYREELHRKGSSGPT